MVSFSHFELDREEGKFYNFAELDNALNRYQDLYSFRSTQPVVKVYFSDEGETFLADFCSEKDLEALLITLCNKHDVAIPEKQLLNNSTNILNAAKSGDIVYFFPATKSYGLNSVPDLLVTPKAVEELLELGYLKEIGAGKFIVNKSI